ncbi:MAG: sigma D regulator [Ferrimonas sp.]
MLTKLEQAVNAWGGSNALVDQWLDSRRQLLIHYCQLAGLAPYQTAPTALPPLKHIRQFCGILLDYVSAGHFEVYKQVSSACEQHGRHSQQLMESILPKIHHSTDIALAFNDRYAEQPTDEQMLQLDIDLSQLGQAMEERFALEDTLLEVLAGHSPTSAAS